MIAVIERHIDRSLSAGEQQSFSFRVLADDVCVFIIRNAAGYFSPVCSPITRAINVRPQIVKSQSVDGGVGRVLIKVAGVENRNFLPGLELFWSDIVPMRAAVVGAMDQAIVGPGPNQINVER